MTIIGEFPGNTDTMIRHARQSLAWKLQLWPSNALQPSSGFILTYTKKSHGIQKAIIYHHFSCYYSQFVYHFWTLTHLCWPNAQLAGLQHFACAIDCCIGHGSSREGAVTLGKIGKGYKTHCFNMWIFAATSLTYNVSCGCYCSLKFTEYCSVPFGNQTGQFIADFP